MLHTSSSPKLEELDFETILLNYELPLRFVIRFLVEATKEFNPIDHTKTCQTSHSFDLAERFSPSENISNEELQAASDANAGYYAVVHTTVHPNYRRDAVAYVRHYISWSDNVQERANSNLLVRMINERFSDLEKTLMGII